MGKLLCKLTRIMKLASLQIVLALLTLSCLYANSVPARKALDQKMGLDLNNTEFIEVLREIEYAGKLNFIYSAQEVETGQVASIRVGQKSIKMVPDEFLEPFSISYQAFYDPSINTAKEVLGSEQSSLAAPITGTVTDTDGNALIGATVTVKGTNIGALTDVNGDFTIDAPADAVLIISYVGFEPQEILIAGRSQIDVVLKGSGVLEAVTVIGSRGKPRSDLDSPVPIDAIQATELAKTGQIDLAQSIHFTVPSFSAQKFGINDLAPLIDPAQLRGLGSDQTLLLVNGKRRHKVAFFNGNDGVGKGQLGNDMNSIPSAAVERVEVLRDGAAAQYGSDAIAGVVNIQLKENSSGGSFMTSYGSALSSPKYDNVTNAGTSGEKIYSDTPITDGANFMTGMNFGLPWGETGFISTTLQYQHSDPTDRSGTYSHSSGWYTANQQAAAGLTDEQLQAQNGINLDRAVLGTADNTNGGIFINAGREITNNIDFYGFGGFTKKQIIGGVFSRSPARTSRAVLDIFPSGYNPEVPSVLTDWQALGGFKTDLGNGWKADFSMGNSGNDLKLFARNTVNPSLGEDSPTQFFTGGLKATQTIFNLDFVKEINEKTTIAFGSEYRLETYRQREGEVDSWRAGTFPDSFVPETLQDMGGADSVVINVIKGLPRTDRDIGSSGREGFTPASTGFWKRNNLGIYAEFETELTDALLVTVAGRYEDYSDFGSDFSYKLASRYKITDALSVRGSYNRSFRAPALAQTHYSNFSQISFDGDGGAIVSPTLPIRDARVTAAFGISNLKPEISNDIALGLTASFGDIKISVDAYQIKVKDRIFIDQAAASDFSGVFGTSGFDDINYFNNAINTTTQGLDIVASYRQVFSETSILDLNFAMNLNETTIDNEDEVGYDRLNNGSDVFVYLIEGTPKSKIIFSPTYRIGFLSILARITNFGKVSEPRLRFNSDIGEWDDNPPGGGEPQILASKSIVDLSLTGHVNDDLSITFSANNLFDEYPDMLRESQVRGEVIYSRRVNQFGTMGRFMSLTLNYKW